MNAPVYWMSRIDEYLTYRRSLGFGLKFDETVLRSFAKFALKTGPHAHLTVKLATDWARSSQRSEPRTWARRIEVLRGFAFYCLRLDEATEVPERNLFGPAHRRLVPHIFTEAELVALLQSAKNLPSVNGLRAATCQTVLGLLAACGLRISEALSLSCDDVDLKAGVLHIRMAKLHKQRLVPLHPSVTDRLLAYARHRDELVVQHRNEHFFVREDGGPVQRASIIYALHGLCKQLGLSLRGDYARHRLHDLRHTFIVMSLLQFYQQDIDVDHSVLALSVYVGHAKVTDTYWYFTGIPELMSIAAGRFHQFAQGETQ